MLKKMTDKRLDKVIQDLLSIVDSGDKYKLQLLYALKERIRRNQPIPQ